MGLPRAGAVERLLEIPVRKKNKRNCCASPGRFFLVTPLLLLLYMQLALSQTSGWQFSGVDRVVAVGDIHGAYDALLATLKNAGVINEHLEWSGGKTHLVFTGDLLDRGADSRQVMDLIMRLETQALAAGGQVHPLIGNHEAMNLVGDLRYVSLPEYAAFAQQESAGERERWFQRYRSAAPVDADETQLRAAFNKRAPAGFYAHRRAFRSDGLYGKWLLDKPLMIVIDGTAFVHGGMSPYVVKHGLQGVNGTLKSELKRYVEALEVLEDRSLLAPADNFYDHVSLLKAQLASVQADDPVMASVKVVMALNDSEIHGATSPLWYRGTVGCGQLIESDVLDKALKRVSATRVVIGHTPTITRHVLQRMDGRVIEIDTGMLTSAYKGSGNALIIEGDQLTVVNENGTTYSPPIEHPRRVGYRAESISADDLARALSSGKVIVSGVDDTDRTMVLFKVHDKTLSAYFDQRSGKAGFLPQLAAYKLDRMLGLDMVPVTVRRELEGRQGTLQFNPAASKTEQERAAAGQGGSAWCPLPKQWNTMYIFDALISNPGRSPQTMLYSPDNWQLMLVQQQRSFGKGKGRPAYLKNIALDISDSWLRALEGLSDAALHDKLAEVLGKRRLAALARRRDRLIKDAGPAN